MAKILFIQVQKYAYPGLYYVCGALKAGGHQYKLISGQNIADIIHTYQDFKPDMVGFSCMTGVHRNIVAMAADIKAAFGDSKIILGGIHPTLYPKVLSAASIDFICRGEGEEALVELLDAIDNNASEFPIANIHYKKNGTIIENPMRKLADPMDDLPFPDYGVYSEIPEIAADEYPMVYIGRGCPYSCSYCHNSNQRTIYKGLGKFVRLFSIDRILKEVQAALEHYPKARAVLLGTDTFGANKQFTRELLARFHERFTIPYTCLIRPELVSEELAGILGETNCHMVAFGIESGSQRMRQQLLNRKYTNQDIIDAANMLRKNGVAFRTYNIIGLPSETREEMLETLQLNMEIRPSFPWASIYTPYPETKLADYSKEHGYLSDDFSFDDVPLSFFNDTLLDNMDRNFIRNIHAFFQASILMPFLFPVFKRLLSLPHNIIFELIFKMVYSYVCIRSENRTLWAFFKLAMGNRHMFKRETRTTKYLAAVLDPGSNDSSQK